MGRHTLVFIHGMGDDAPVEGYETLWSGIRAAYGERHNVDGVTFDTLFVRNFVVWETVTASAKLDVFTSAFPGYEPRPPSLEAVVHPVQAMRTFMTFFLGDVVAYVSDNDNNVRRTVWSQMKGLLAKDTPYSIVAHSLGSVIAFDYVFNLFDRGILFRPLRATPEEVETLKKGFVSLFTMGSPGALFMLRQGKLWDPRIGGEHFDKIVNPLPDASPWLNFWDKEDIIAYPAAQLFRRNPANQGKMLEDVEVQTGNLVVNSHIGYWKNADVARRIALALPSPSSIRSG